MPYFSIASQHLTMMGGTSTPSRTICSARSTPNVGFVRSGSCEWLLLGVLVLWDVGFVRSMCWGRGGSLTGVRSDCTVSIVCAQTYETFMFGSRAARTPLYSAVGVRVILHIDFKV